jgi:hypothetical protein
MCRLSVLLLVCAVVLTAFAQCGQERWPVKVGTDVDASAVLTLCPRFPPQSRTFTVFPHPDPFPRTAASLQPKRRSTRLPPRWWNSCGRTTRITTLVLSDESGRTVIAEIPAPTCTAGSRFETDIAVARATFDARYHPTASFQRAMVPIEIRGVGFLDFRHGQHGVAPNAIELHPVLGINFYPFAPPPPPAAAVRQRAYAQGTAAAPVFRAPGPSGGAKVARQFDHAASSSR